MSAARKILLLALSILLSSPANAQTPRTAPKASRVAKASPVPALPAPAPVLEPKAIEILKAACSRLGAAHSMSFTAVISYENPSRLGPPLIYTVRDDVTLQRPDKLKVITPGDGPASEFYYDGKTMSAFAPAENLIAMASAPPTIDAALQDHYGQSLASGAAVAEAGRRATAVALRRRAGRSQCSPRPLLLQAMRRELHDAVAAADDRASWKATIRTTSSGSS